MLTYTGYPDHFFPFRKISLVWRTNFWAQQRKRNKGKPQESWHFLATSSRQAWSSPLTASKWKPLVSHLRNTARRKWNAALHVLHLLSMSAHHAVNSSSCNAWVWVRPTAGQFSPTLQNEKKNTHHKSPEQSPSNQSMNHQQIIYHSWTHTAQRQAPSPGISTAPLLEMRGKWKLQST